jgi:hypothetical protein
MTSPGQRRRGHLNYSKDHQGTNCQEVFNRRMIIISTPMKIFHRTVNLSIVPPLTLSNLIVDQAIQIMRLMNYGVIFSTWNNLLV